MIFVTKLHLMNIGYTKLRTMIFVPKLIDHEIKDHCTAENIGCNHLRCLRRIQTRFTTINMSTSCTSSIHIEQDIVISSLYKRKPLRYILEKKIFKMEIFNVCYPLYTSISKKNQVIFSNNQENNIISRIHIADY